MPTQPVLEPGAEAPDFSLRGPGGVFYSLSEFRGERHVLVAFFPLAFSPVCSHQLPELQAALPQLEAAGVTVLGVSVDSHFANAAFARALKLGFPLLSDWGRDTSRAYGVLDARADTSGRALFLVNREGRLVWSEISDDPESIEQVPSPERALAALAAAPRD
ncbi:MAG: redoxin domain-containing protein [Candidatus Eisenbacteria bacterium]|nr:redoxin domain-containing protein [Candidatus Eisenbacteria bacterium]